MPRCSKCGYYSDKTFNVKKHEKIHTKESVARKKSKTYNCQLCTTVHNCRDELIKHFTSAHGVQISKKQLRFETEHSFFSWKAQVEKNSSSRFVQHRGILQYINHKTAQYYCHRDGFFSPQGKGKRRLKLLGSNKLNTCCPAQITATTNIMSGSVDVEFTETHVGHKQDLGRLNLSKDVKKEIDSKNSTVVQLKEILKGIKESIQSKDAQYSNLLTSDDLWNIQQEFNLDNERHQNDYISVHSWVTQNQGNQVVRFYKQQGTLLHSRPELSSDDFILIFANESQLTMLEEFGNECVCLDVTRSLQNDLELTTILVLDELRQGFPCGFMLSNRADAAVLKIFVTVIKNELDSPVVPKVFMSDMAEAYRDAWCDVMPPPDNVLFCTWHVDRAWKKNLSKVKDDVKKAEVYKTLLSLLEETDQNAFSQLLEAFLTTFQNDPDKRDFGTYFTLEYADCVQQWASCYRVHLGLNANTHLESLHDAIKHCYFEGKKVKRLDKFLHVLMRVIRDKLFDRIITYHRGTLAKKIADIRRRHTAALQMTDFLLDSTEQGWSVSSSESPTTYSILPWNTECTCDLRCADCDLCIHSFKCDCLDSSVMWVICPHIHFMAANTGSTATIQYPHNESLSPNETGSDGGLSIDEQHDIIQEIILEAVSEEHDDSTVFESRKKSILDEFRKALELAHSMDDLDVCQNAVRPLMPTIEAARSTNEVIIAKRKIDTPKKMKPQKSLFSTKNKKKRMELLLCKQNNSSRVKTEALAEQ